MPTDTRPAMHPTAALVAALRFAVDALPVSEGGPVSRYVEAHGDVVLCIARAPSPGVDAALERLLRPLGIVPDPHATVDGRAVPEGMGCTVWRWAERATPPVRVEGTADGLALVFLDGRTRASGFVLAV